MHILHYILYYNRSPPLCRRWYKYMKSCLCSKPLSNYFNEQLKECSKIVTERIRVSTVMLNLTWAMRLCLIYSLTNISYYWCETETKSHVVQTGKHAFELGVDDVKLFLAIHTVQEWLATTDSSFGLGGSVVLNLVSKNSLPRYFNSFL